MPFKEMTTAGLIQCLKAFKFTRKITQWHIHHTWKPSYNEFDGTNHQKIQQSMKDYHIKTNGWSDIGQHLTLFPDGKWLLGRDFNKDPASILGWNTGALAVEIVGNFDKGGDSMLQAQKDAIYEVTEFLVEQMQLVPKFHRDSPTAYKTCPGNNIDRETFFKEAFLFTENKQAKEKATAEAKLKAMQEIANQVRTVFKDMLVNGKPHFANDHVNFLYDRKIVKGYPDGTFKPDEPLERGEFAVMLAKAIESIEEKIHAVIKEYK